MAVQSNDVQQTETLCVFGINREIKAASSAPGDMMGVSQLKRHSRDLEGQI